MLPSTEKYILVVGLGRSGRAAALFFRRSGYDVVVTDIDPGKSGQIPELEALGIKCEIGFHRVETFERAGLIVVSPGIAVKGEHFDGAILKGVTIRGELDIAAELVNKPIVAITGTNGKTTVTTLVGEMLKASGMNVFVGGNIGTPLIECLEISDRFPGCESDKNVNGVAVSSPYNVIVAEVSSFQLDIAHNFAPEVAVLLNITEDHLNRYSGFGEYEDSKWSIFSCQSADSRAVINRSIAGSDERAAALKSRVTFFNDSQQKFDDLINLSRLKGKHNRENIEAAIYASLYAGASLEGVEKAIRCFGGLAHRIEYVAEVSGVSFYDDSKGTNCDAVVRALESFDEKVILIMGGEDKNTDFSVLKNWVRDKTRQVILIGEARDKIHSALSGACDAVFAGSMSQAVNLAFAGSKPGDIVLLSPGCASFDMYRSYAERGDDFASEVKKLLT